MEQVSAPDTSNQVAALEKELAGIETRITRLIALYEVGNMPLETLQTRITELQTAKQTVAENLQQTKNTTTGVDPVAVDRLIQELSKTLENGRFGDLRGILLALIDHIVIDEDDVTIFWRFSSPL